MNFFYENIDSISNQQFQPAPNNHLSLQHSYQQNCLMSEPADDYVFYQMGNYMSSYPTDESFPIEHDSTIFFAKDAASFAASEEQNGMCQNDSESLHIVVTEEDDYHQHSAKPSLVSSHKKRGRKPCRNNADMGKPSRQKLLRVVENSPTENGAYHDDNNVSISAPEEVPSCKNGSSTHPSLNFTSLFNSDDVGNRSDDNTSNSIDGRNSFNNVEKRASPMTFFPLSPPVCPKKRGCFPKYATNKLKHWLFLNVTVRMECSTFVPVPHN